MHYIFAKIQLRETNKRYIEVEKLNNFVLITTKFSKSN